MSRRSPLEAAREVVRQAGADQTALDRLAELLDLLGADPGVAGNLVLDFGLVRGLAYYNGIIFEVKHPTRTGSLGGGGRYDGLSRALGSTDTVPALGFAYTLETLSELTEESIGGDRTAPQRRSVLVLAEGREAFQSALQVAVEMRGGEAHWRRWRFVAGSWRRAWLTPQKGLNRGYRGATKWKANYPLGGVKGAPNGRPFDPRHEPDPGQHHLAPGAA